MYQASKCFYCKFELIFYVLYFCKNFNLNRKENVNLTNIKKQTTEISIKNIYIFVYLLKKKLDSVVTYRTNVQARLEQHVQTLDQLNSALHLLEELRDMENKIDGIYLPLETMYLKLR